ncbi:MAG: DEAD/DEAH box helicase [Flavobacteriaceae bacterium]|nr:DEAD/DEAH box helicase [Flavobacteriaceae bacterium]
MNLFENFNLNKPLHNAIEELGFDTPTPIQIESFPVILSGKDVVGIAQTGTGKTLAYMLPILQELKFSKQVNPRVLILVPTRELVLQVVERVESFTKYMNIKTLGVYGGVNINTQKQQVVEGTDILVATPGRLYDLTVSRVLQLKSVQKLVIDEVDVMLDLGFRFQLTNIFELLPERRQNIMYSATMTEDIDVLIDDFFKTPVKISIAVSGTPLENIAQQCYKVPNFFTKVNLLKHLLKDKNEFSKVLVFVSDKKNADRVFELIEPQFGAETCIIHSNKTQNYRIRSIQQFNKGINRIIIATDVMARGLDLDKISHVINFDTPHFPENYMHRIGRTGRAEQAGKSILFYTDKEKIYKDAIEKLMSYEIPIVEFPSEVGISIQLTPEERPIIIETHNRTSKTDTTARGFHEKSDKNKKTNQGGSYRRELAKKYKKPKTRGDKNFNKNLRKK